MANLPVGKNTTIADRDKPKRGKIGGGSKIPSRTTTLNPEKTRLPVKIQALKNEKHHDIDIVSGVTNPSKNCKLKDKKVRPNEKKDSVMMRPEPLTRELKGGHQSPIREKTRVLDKRQRPLTRQESPCRTLEYNSNMYQQSPIREEAKVLKRRKPLVGQASPIREHKDVHQSPIRERTRVLDKRQRPLTRQESPCRTLEYNSNMYQQSPIGEAKVLKRRKPLTRHASPCRQLKGVHQSPIRERTRDLDKRQRPLTRQESPCRTLEYNSNMYQQSPIREEAKVLKRRKPLVGQASPIREHKDVHQSPIRERTRVLDKRQRPLTRQESPCRTLEYNSNMYQQSPIGEAKVLKRRKPLTRHASPCRELKGVHQSPIRERTRDLDKRQRPLTRQESPCRTLEYKSNMYQQSLIREEAKVLKRRKPLMGQASPIRKLEFNSSMKRQSPIEEKANVLNQQKPSAVCEVPSTSRELDFNSNINRQSPTEDEDSLLNQQKPPEVCEVPSTSRELELNSSINHENPIEEKDSGLKQRKSVVCQVPSSYRAMQSTFKEKKRLDDKLDELGIPRSHDPYRDLSWPDPRRVRRIQQRGRCYTLPSVSKPDIVSVESEETIICKIPNKVRKVTEYLHHLFLTLIIGISFGLFITLSFFFVCSYVKNLFWPEPEYVSIYDRVLDGALEALTAMIEVFYLKGYTFWLGFSG